VILKTCACGRTSDEAYVLSHLVGIQEGLGSVPPTIMFNCVCRSTISIVYATAPDAVQRAADRLQESADLLVALG